jgi:serine/threonine-protein kinase RIO1
LRREPGWYKAARAGLQESAAELFDKVTWVLLDKIGMTDSEKSGIVESLIEGKESKMFENLRNTPSQIEAKWQRREASWQRERSEYQREIAQLKAQLNQR